MFNRVCFILVILALALSNTANADNLSGSGVSTALPTKPVENCCAGPKDPSVWDKSITAGYNYTDGNSRSSNLNVNAKISRDFENNIWRFEGDYNFGDAASDNESSRDETKNNYKASADYRRLFENNYFAGIGAEIKHDEIADVHYRVPINPAVGLFLIREDDAKFSIEAGPSYIFEDVGGEKNDYLAPRIADRLEYKISPTASIFQSAEIFIDAEDSDNYIFNGEAGVEAALTSLFNLVFVIRDSYDNQPAIDRDKNDVALISGLKVNL